MSRSQQTDEPQKFWIGYDVTPPEVTKQEQLHWYEAYKLGYRATKWNRPDADQDDGRFDLKEKED